MRIVDRSGSCLERKGYGLSSVHVGDICGCRNGYNLGCFYGFLDSMGNFLGGPRSVVSNVGAVDQAHVSTMCWSRQVFMILSYRLVRDLEELIPSSSRIQFGLQIRRYRFSLRLLFETEHGRSAWPRAEYSDR